MRAQKNKNSQIKLAAIFWFALIAVTSFLLLQHYNPKFLRIKKKVGLNVLFSSAQLYHFINKNKDLEKNIINLKIQTNKNHIKASTQNIVKQKAAAQPSNLFKSIPGALSFSKGRQTKVIISPLYYSQNELQTCATQCLLQVRDSLGYSLDLSFFKIAHIKSFSKIKGEKITATGVIRNNQLFLSKVSQAQ